MDDEGRLPRSDRPEGRAPAVQGKFVDRGSSYGTHLALWTYIPRRRGLLDFVRIRRGWRILADLGPIGRSFGARSEMG
jgi:hypothetical protein